MSIVFDIYDDISQKVYTFRDIDDNVTEPPKILVDEDDKSIKEKLFWAGGRHFYPNLTKIRKDGLRLYVTSMFDFVVTDTRDFSSFLVDIERNNGLLISAVQEYRDAGFKDLEKEDLLFIAKFTVYDQLLGTNNQTMLNQFDTKDLNDYVDALDVKQVVIEQKYESYSDPSSLINKFYKQLSSNSPLPGTKVFYNNIVFSITGKNVKDGYKGRFVNLEAIFNTFPVSDSIPMIAIGGGTSEPMIKVYNNLLRNVNDREFKSWILNERKKSNIVSFKKIKGLLIKVWNGNNSDFLTFHLNENGEIICRFSSKDGQVEIEKAQSEIYRKANEIITAINVVEGAFFKSQTIDLVENSKVKVTSVSAKVEVDMFIDRDTFRDSCYDVDIKPIFEVKQTKSEEVLSLYYKHKMIEEDTMQLSIAISDHRAFENKSVVTIYNASSMELINIVTQQIVALSIVSGVSDRKTKVRGVSEIKELRKAGADIQSTKCQKPRQPMINETDAPLPKSYVIQLKGKRFVCPKKEYPYPGFTNENIICCFKKDQRRRDAYIRNMNTAEADILVQPSNLLVTIEENDSQPAFKTFVIKVVSEYVEGLDESNSMGRYYYISNENTLMPITNNKLIEEVENLQDSQEKDIWLDVVPFTRIVNDPPKNKCNFPPDLKEKSNNDINSPCAHHAKNKFFGYNLHSYPCCFDKEREVFTTKTKKVFDITKQHIYKTDKTLDYQRIGVLPPALNKLFNKSDEKYYRMGVVQNSAAFLNAVLLATNNVINESVVNNSFEFKRMIIDRLQQNPKEYNTLNNGMLTEKYGSLSNYTMQLTDANVRVYWGDVIDIVQRMTGMNIYILDIPYKYTDLTKSLDYTNMRLICQFLSFAGKETRNKNIILLKKEWSFEVIVYINGEQIMYTFENSNEMIQFMDKFYSETCIKVDVYPDQYPYDPLYSFEHVQRVLKKSPHSVTQAMIGSNNKIYYALTKSNMMIPTRERGLMDGVSTTNISPRQTLQEFEKSCNDLKKYKLMMSIRGISITDDNKVNAVLTNFGQFVPLMESDVLENNKYPITDSKYYSETQLSNDSQNEGQVWSKEINEIKEAVYRAKLALGRYFMLNVNEKEEIVNFIVKARMSRPFKILQISDSVSNALKALLPNDAVVIDNLNFISGHIATEIIDDNIQNLLVNNIVTSDLYDPKRIVVRENESVLFNLSDIRKWIKTFKETDES